MPVTNDDALDALSNAIKQTIQPVPTPAAPDFGPAPDGTEPALKKHLNKIRAAFQEIAGNRGDPLNAAVRWGDLVKKGFATPGFDPTGGGGGAPSPPGPPGPPGPAVPYVPDLTPPPTVTGLSAAAGLTSIIVQWDVAGFAQGHGPKQTNIYAHKQAASDPSLPTFSDAVLVTAAPQALTIVDIASDLSIKWYVWAKYESNDGVESASPAGGVNGVFCETGLIGNVDLGPLIIQAGNLADGSVTASKYAMASLPLTAFASGLQPVGVVAALPNPVGYTGALTVLLTTDGKLYRYVSGNWTRAVDGADLVANSITAGSIQAGAIGTAQLAAGAVTTGKLLVTGQGAALNGDPNTQDISAWGTGPGTSSIVTLTDGVVGSSALQNTAAPGNFCETDSAQVPCVPGATYRLSAWARQLSGVGVSYFRIYFNDASGGFISTGYSVGLEGFTLTGSFVQYRGTTVAPANAVTMRLAFITNYPTGGAGVVQFQGTRLEQATDFDLIVDGAIIASKLAANAIAVGSAAIQNGAIVNAMIANATIDDAKIGNVSAAKLTAGSGVIGGNLMSSNYVFGSTGWIVQPGGYAEFGAAAIRGQLVAAQIGAGIIDATKINVSSLSAISANMGTITAGTLGASTIFAGALSAATGTFAGALSAATGTFAGSLSAATGTFAGALSAASGTFAGTLTAAALTVAGNSIFLPAYVKGNGPTTISFTGTDVLTAASVNPGSTGSVLITATFEFILAIANSDSEGGSFSSYTMPTFSILRNGSAVDTWTPTLGASTPARQQQTRTFQDAPGGAAVYKFHMKDNATPASASAPLAFACTMQVAGVMR